MQSKTVLAGLQELLKMMPLQDLEGAMSDPDPEADADQEHVLQSDTPQLPTMVEEADGTQRPLTPRERRRLRRRVTNRNSALRMRSRRQEELSSAQIQARGWRLDFACRGCH